MTDRPQIFLSYAREDGEAVAELYQKLTEAGFKPWMDTRDILPGEQWPNSIQRAIRNSGFFMACLSPNSIEKRGYVQRELNEALNIWQEKLDSDIYLIPVRLKPCEMPESLDKFQSADLFKESGWPLVLRAIEEGMKRQGKTVTPAVEPLVLVPEDELPARHRGLIVLVGIGRPGEDPMRQSAGAAIEYHIALGDEVGLETCWLIATRGQTGSLPIAGKLKEACQARNINAIIRTVADPFSVQETYDVVQRIYAQEAPEAGLSEHEVMADFTGGVKPMSAGMILACGDRRPMQYMTGRKGGIASIPMLVQFRPWSPP